MWTEFWTFWLPSPLWTDMVCWLTPLENHVAPPPAIAFFSFLAKFSAILCHMWLHIYNKNRHGFFRNSLPPSLSTKFMNDPCVYFSIKNRPLGLPKTIESFITSIYSKNGGPCIGLGHSSISFKNDNFGPDLVIYTLPFIQHLLDMVLKIKNIICYCCDILKLWNLFMALKF